MTNGDAQAKGYTPAGNSIMSSIIQALFGIFIAIIFWTVFDSPVLGLLAFAFLFYIPSLRQEIGMFTNAIIFGFVMILALVLAFQGSGVSGLGLDLGEGASFFNPATWNTSAIVFVGFWAIALLAGIFEIESRQVIGVFMIAIAFFFFSVGPGTQEVGTAFFGQWWPSVYQFSERTLTPAWEGLSGFFNTISQGFSLLTNPVGYATQLMNGTHATNPQGQTGAHGVEFLSMDESPIYVETPFLITAIVQNKGVFDTKDIEFGIKVISEDAPRNDKTTPDTPLAIWFDESMSIKFDCGEIKTIAAISHDEQDNTICIKTVDGTLPVQSVHQEVFSSERGLTCDVVSDFELREKAIPFELSVTYDYGVNSSVEIEFMSPQEWDRLAGEGLLDMELRTVQSQYSTAPVVFPIGTAGLKNPIKSDQTFHIGMRLEPDGKNGRIEKIYRVVLNLPEDFKFDASKCSPTGSAISGNKGIIWSGAEFGSSAIIYCPMELKDDAMGGSPTKTYLVTAYAEYEFTRIKRMTSKVEFGGKCCSEDDCLGGQVCCQPTDGNGGYCMAGTEDDCEGTVLE
jgi:hypothetical protein